MESSVIRSTQAVRVEGRLKRLADSVERLMRTILTLCGFVTVALVVLITGFLVVSGLPAIREVGLLKFIFGTVWNPTASPAEYGILPFILSSTYGTLGAVLLSVPLGVMCAVGMAKLSTGRVTAALNLAVETMAGIPSVVYGLVGMIVVVPTVRDTFGLSDGANLLSSMVVLAMMVLPSVVSVSETALRAVPKEYEEASLALGATQIETVFKVSIPTAKSGILTSVVLGIGRAIGEAMAVMMVSGNVANMPSLFSSVRFLTTAVASEMSYSSGLQRQALFSIALVLFVAIMLLNLLLNYVVHRKDGRP